MREVGVAVARENDRRYGVFCHESDVRSVCQKLPCGEHNETCMRLMEESMIMCELCYGVLSTLRKYPVKTELVW
jgi:hypothetical protein